MKLPSEKFKAHPNSHAFCFNCHWAAQKPIREDCNICHALALSPYFEEQSPKRISAEFSHEGGGKTKDHRRECTKCHLNITKEVSLRSGEPDVPILACKQCHSQETPSQSLQIQCNELRGAHVISDELSCLKADKKFVCRYCHAADKGELEPPVSHFLVANEKRFKREDLK